MQKVTLNRTAALVFAFAGAGMLLYRLAVLVATY
jgi:hypothetical protein